MISSLLSNRNKRDYPRQQGTRMREISRSVEPFYGNHAIQKTSDDGLPKENRLFGLMKSGK